MSSLTDCIGILFVCKGHGADQFSRGISLLKVPPRLFRVASPPNLHAPHTPATPTQTRCQERRPP